MITNESATLATVTHAYYDDSGNPVGEMWSSDIPGSQSGMYDLSAIDSLPDGYTGYGIFSSETLITATVLSTQRYSVYLPLVLKQPPPGVRILENHTAYVDSSGYLHLVGEVQNTTVEHLRFVQIHANIFDRSGQLLDTEFTYTHLDTVPAGEKTCFEVWLEAPVGWASYEFEAPTYWTDGDPLPNLTFFNDSGSYDPTFGWYEIIGQVRNDHGARVAYVSPVGTVYDTSGQVIGCEFTFVNSTHLDPGQTSAFEMTFTGRDYEDVASYRVQVDGDVQ